MKRFLRSHSPRRQLLLAAGLTLAGGLIIALGIIEPLHTMRSSLQVEQESLERELSQVQSLAQELENLRRSAPEQSSDGIPLTTLVDQSLQGRPFQPSRIQLNEAGQMQLRLEGVAFEEALSWLQELETYPGVLATAVTVARDQGGRINLGLTLQRL
jgi:type II secretory pathway component PulM